MADERFWTASIIEAGDHMDRARIVASDMYAEVHSYQAGPKKGVPRYMDGCLSYQLLDNGYNKTGEGEPTHYICIQKVNEWQWKKWNGLIEKYGLKEVGGNYKFIKIDSKENLLARMRLKEVGRDIDWRGRHE